MRYHLGNSTGNPGVRQAYPDPNPRYPVPLARVPGITGWGHGFHGSNGSIGIKIPILGVHACIYLINPIPINLKVVVRLVQLR